MIRENDNRHLIFCYYDYHHDDKTLASLDPSLLKCSLTYVDGNKDNDFTHKWNFHYLANTFTLVSRPYGFMDWREDKTGYIDISINGQSMVHHTYKSFEGFGFGRLSSGHVLKLYLEEKEDLIITIYIVIEAEDPTYYEPSLEDHLYNLRTHPKSVLKYEEIRLTYSPSGESGGACKIKCSESVRSGDDFYSIIDQI